MSCASSPLGLWLATSGGSFHPSLEFKQDALGNSVYAAQALPPGAAAVSCPFSLAITPTSARRCLSSLFGSSKPSDRQVVALYLALHHVFAAGECPAGIELLHRPYVDTLPKPEEMRTPCYYREEEMQLLAGTNLVGATRDRLAGWRVEWEELKAMLLDRELADKVTWDAILWACTILSSRAFPSSLIEGDTAHSTPVLFPAVDTLNHRLGAKASWITDVNEPAVQEPHGKLAIVLDEGVAEGQQAFNTYGPKPNEELLLGYGFTTPSNPSDLVALKLSIPPPQATPLDLSSTLSALSLDNLRHFVPRSGVIPARLLAQMRLFMAGGEEEFESVEAGVKKGKGWEEVLGFLGWENELDVLDALEGMLESKLQGLRSGAEAAKGVQGVREGVRETVDEYRRGQIDVLEAALEWRSQLFEQTIERAKAAGVDLMMEDVEEDDEEME